jgi:putative Holliday junction resolvase
MRMMGLDVGSKTIGVAVSDMLHITAQGITTIAWDEHDMTSADPALEKLIKEYDVTKIIIGNPKNMSGTNSARADISKIYQKRLERIFDIPTELFDERLTTVQAERTLLSADVSRKKRKNVIDKMAAVFILQTYLDLHG